MSKFKPVATRTLPRELLVFLNSEEFAKLLLHRVLEDQLRIPDSTSRPAGHYVQECDHSIEVDGHRGIELTLSKVSVRDGRYFQGALTMMQRILTDVVHQFVPKGEPVQIFCIIATDQPVYGTDSTLFEMIEEMWVEGKAAA